jgi:maleate isomerase
MTDQGFNDLDQLTSLPALGLIVPPANPTVEPEMTRLIASGARLFSTRLPVMPNTTLEQRNRAYLDTYLPAAQSFGSLDIKAMIVALTGPSYRLGPQGDAEFCRSLSLQAGVRVETASHAISETLSSLKARRICLFSPYPQWLTDEAAHYWREAGYEITQIVKVSDTFRAYELSTEEVEEALAAVDMTRIDAIVMSGTGMITLPAIAKRAGASVPPFLSSNICCAFWLLRELNIAPGALFRQAAPQLASLLS